MTSSSDPSHGASARLQIAAVLLAVGVRLALMAGGLARLDDPDNYLPLARSIARGDGFAINGRATAFRPPLYPLMLTPVVATLPDRALPWGVGAIHLLMGGGTVALVGWLLGDSGCRTVGHCWPA